MLRSRDADEIQTRLTMFRTSDILEALAEEAESGALVLRSILNRRGFKDVEEVQKRRKLVLELRMLAAQFVDVND